MDYIPDPQMKKVNKRLPGTRFMNLYRSGDEARRHRASKTDSPFLYKYTGLMTALNRAEDGGRHCRPYAAGGAGDILGIRTFYEQQ